MKFIIVFVALFAVVLAAPRPAAPRPADEVTILRSVSDVGPESFNYAYETSDGVAANQEGHLKNVGTENEALSVRGSFTWVAADGQKYTVDYVADENGFQPQGAHLPVAPQA